jgi:hypothetical protein
MIRNHEFDAFDQNFSEAELMWNRGASQDEKELKEAFLDIETLDSRLWIRPASRNVCKRIVPHRDQFNPQDRAHAREPRRVADRVVGSAWRLLALPVGPLEDVRLEFAMNLTFETGLGRCSELHTLAGVRQGGGSSRTASPARAVGEVRPRSVDDASGIELGGRIEFRWDRYSFAVSDFWGYDDFPYVDQVFLYERNVDPRTGRPRRAGATGSCTTGNEPGCLGPDEDALLHHHANQQRFALICASSVGFSNLDRAACAQSVFNSQNLPAASGLGMRSWAPCSPVRIWSARVAGRLPQWADFLGDTNHDSVTVRAVASGTLVIVVRADGRAGGAVGCGSFWQTNDDDGWTC